MGYGGERDFGGIKDLDKVYGTLPDWAILGHIYRGDIKISPFPDNLEDVVGHVSIDLRLGTEIKKLKPSNVPIDLRNGVSEEDYECIDLSSGEPYIFKPGDFIIAKTHERITLPNNIKGVMEGKSSLARIGVGVFVTAARFDPGWDGNPVLELTNSGGRPFTLYPLMKICAFSFDKLTSSVDRPYNGRYVGGTVHSLVHKDNGIG